MEADASNSEKIRELSNFMEQDDTINLVDNDLQARVAYYDLQTTLNPGDSSSWINLGLAHQQAGNFHAADQAFTRGREAKANQ